MHAQIVRGAYSIFARSGFFSKLVTAWVVLSGSVFAQIPGQVFLTEILQKGLANPSLTFATSAESVPAKQYPVYLRFKSKRCKTCRYEINRAWINGKLLKHGKLSWEFESLSGERPYLLKIDLDELKDNKVLRSRVLYGDLTTQTFTSVVSLDLVVP